MDQIIITRPDGTSLPIETKGEVTKIIRAEQKINLLNEDVVTMTVESPLAQNFNIGAKIVVYGRDYTMNQLPSVKKNGERRFSYELTFEGVQYDLLRAQYEVSLDTTGAEVWGDSLMADLRRFMEVLVVNANRATPGRWSLGECPDTDTRNMNFGGEDSNCLAVLQRFCSEFKVEFQIEQRNGRCIIHIREAGTIFPFTFKYGKGLGLYDLKRQNVSSANIITRLKVYGGSQNLGSSYRNDRICLPGKTKAKSYIDAPEAIKKYGIWEATKYFEEHHPKRKGYVTGLGDSVLKFSDSSMFDLNAKKPDGSTKYLIDGVAAKVKFNTGMLAGYEFDLTSYDHKTTTFVLKKFTDERGMIFPSETSAAFQVGVGDEYVLLDINMPDEYIETAEKNTEEDGQIYLDQNSQPKVQYGLSITEDFLASMVGEGVGNIFTVGDYISVEDEDLSVDKSIRITGFIRDLLRPYKYSLTIGDTFAKSITNRVISEIKEIDRIIQINNLGDPAKARRKWLTTQELKDMVFDPDGDYFSDKIKPGSIETMMLSVAAKSTQFMLQNTTIEANYTGKKNVVRVTGGLLSHYTIVEDSIREWSLASMTTTLTNDSAYYIYVKCPIMGDAATIIFSSNQMKVDAEDNYYHFWIGVLHSVIDDVRAISLTYGSTTINGRFIKTGRIESSGDGNTYFDLDNGEIGGKMYFKDGLVSGLIGIGNDSVIYAGMSGIGGSSSDVRVWVGQTTANRAIAPFRVLHDGSFVATKAQIEGIIKAVSGEIGGFYFDSGRIGAIQDLENDKYKGLGLYNDFIKFSNSSTYVGMGTNILPMSSGAIGLARLEYTGNYWSGMGLNIKFRPSETHPWYFQRAIQNDGNVFSKGGHCIVDDLYVGQAYTDIIEEYIGKSTQYTFSSIGVALLGVDLPSRTIIQRELASGNSYTFLLHITIAASSNKIRLRSVSGGQIKNNNGGNVEYIDMAYGDILILRYYNGNYYQIAHRQ